jgi:hypothetical protein
VASGEATPEAAPRPKPPASTFGTTFGTAVRWSAPVAPRAAGAKPSEKILPSFPAAIRIDPHAAPEESPEVSHEVLPASRPTLTRFDRVVRKVRRWLGLSVGRTPARCSGTARNGSACRGIAMDNGLCRMHGGKRERSIVAMIS